MLTAAHQRRQRGLTLIEVVVVMTIVAMAMAMALPSISAWLRNQSVRAAAESMRAGVERARIEALRRNTQLGFWMVTDSSGKLLTNNCTLSTSGPSWVVSVNSPAGACGAAPSMTVAPRLVDSWSAAVGAVGVTVAGTDADGNAVDNAQFNSLGQLQPGGLAVINVTDTTAGAVPLRVMISVSGSIRVCMPSAPAGDARSC